MILQTSDNIKIWINIVSNRSRNRLMYLFNKGNMYFEPIKSTLLKTTWINHIIFFFQILTERKRSWSIFVLKPPCPFKVGHVMLFYRLSSYIICELLCLLTDDNGVFSRCPLKFRGSILLGWLTPNLQMPVFLAI